mgnify:CR=1 FL=1
MNDFCFLQRELSGGLSLAVTNEEDIERAVGELKRAVASRGAHRPNDIIKALRLIAAAQAIDLELQRRPRVRSARGPPSEIEEVGFVFGPSFARHPVCGPQLKKVVEVARSKPFGVCVDVRGRQRLAHRGWQGL